MRAALIALLLAGCAQLQPEPAVAPVSEIIALAVETSRLPADAQRRALARADGEYAREASAANRVRLAALLAMLPAPLRDDARAVALLQPLAAGDAARPLVQFASLLGAQVAERQRVLRAAERREEMAREREAAARERESAAKERESAAREREAAGKEREAALRQQIEAMRAIERGILEREERGRSRTTR